ncbi:MAG: hypothetical protein GY816_05705 [Cytophagales bacterium]|nr:hypothetical protein [Cytophagales bacterium]
MKIIISILLTLLSFVSLAQYDSTLRINFKSVFEQKVLTNISQSDDLSLLLAISPKADSMYVVKVKTLLEEFREELVKKKFLNKSEEKKIKLLFELTHKYFFTKYQEISNFSEIFESSEYNCVSATALYVLLLKAYDIPFSIKEAPTHVYSIAYPKTKGIIIESTAPENGYYYPSEANMQKAVKSLVDLKYVTQEEVNNKGTKKVYVEFFYDEDVISVLQLAGRQYSNEAISYLQENNFEEALNSIHKTQLLNPSKDVKFLQHSILALLLQNTSYDNFKEVVWLTEFSNLSSENRPYLIEGYQVILNNQLIVNGDPKFTLKAFDYLQKNLKDSILLQTISEFHYNGFANYHNQLSNSDSSLMFATKAYQLNKKNVKTQARITSLIVQKMSRKIGSIKAANELEEYVNEFAFLKINSLYQSLCFYHYSRISYLHFRADNMPIGVEYLDKMEGLLEIFGENLKIDESHYGQVYAELGALHFRNRDYKKAKNTLEKGLSIMPDQPELKIRLDIVLDEME